MALVSQDTALFDDTVGANIALGRLGAQQEEVSVAARAAFADEFISTLPVPMRPQWARLDEICRADSGRELPWPAQSCGMRPSSLLDEATSALDAESEARVQAALPGSHRGERA